MEPQEDQDVVPEEVQTQDQLLVQVLEQMKSHLGTDGFTLNRTKSSPTSTDEITAQMVELQSGDATFSVDCTSISNTFPIPVPYLSREMVSVVIRDAKALTHVDEGEVRQVWVHTYKYPKTDGDEQNSTATAFTKTVKKDGKTQEAPFPDDEKKKFLKEVLGAQVDRERTNNTFEEVKKSMNQYPNEPSSIRWNKEPIASAPAKVVV
jgi:hypothetical protein